MTVKTQIEPEIINRQELLKLCAKILQKLDKKISGRYRPSDNENLYLQTIRAISGLVDSTNRILKDNDLEELQRRIEQLEEQTNP
jgi:hypothetical protein